VHLWHAVCLHRRSVGAFLATTKACSQRENEPVA